MTKRWIKEIKETNIFTPPQKTAWAWKSVFCLIKQALELFNMEEYRISTPIHLFRSFIINGSDLKSKNNGLPNECGQSIKSTIREELEVSHPIRQTETWNYCQHSMKEKKKNKKRH